MGCWRFPSTRGRYSLRHWLTATFSSDRCYRNQLAPRPHAPYGASALGKVLRQGESRAK